MTELAERCQAVINLEKTNDKLGLDKAISDLKSFLNSLEGKNDI